MEVMAFTYVMEFSHISNRVAFPTGYSGPPGHAWDTDTAQIKERESDFRASLKKIQKKAEIGNYRLQRQRTNQFGEI